MLGVTNTSISQASMNNLSISINGVNKLTYNGKSAASLDISLSSLDAAASNHNHDSVYSKLNHTHDILSFNNNSLVNATYGDYWGVTQNSGYDSTTDWLSVIKILNLNSAGCYTELAQSITGEERLQHRRLLFGALSDWKIVLDSANYSKYALPLSGGAMANTNVVANLNADMVNYSHAWQMQTLALSGERHGTAHQVICQHNVNQDNRFFFRLEANNYELSIHHAMSCNNSVLFCSKPWTSFVTGPFDIISDVDLANSNPDHAVISDCDPAVAPTPTGGWCHFISLPHRNRNDHTAQIIIPFFNIPELYVRSAPGNTPGNLGTLARFYSSYNSNAVTTASTSPSSEYVWCQ